MTRITGKASKSKLTKHLIHTLKKDCIPIISHKGIDLVAAQDLANKKIKAILNCAPSLEPSSSNEGVKYLLEEGIYIFDVKDGEIFNIIHDGDAICIIDSELHINNQFWCYLKPITSDDIKELNQYSLILHETKENFIKNTINHMQEEFQYFLSNVCLPEISTEIEGREVIIVSRGRGYRQDLMLVKNYIANKNPVIISVDGGADALYDLRVKSHIIIGDMDSVSDKSLKGAQEILVHSYLDGYAPGEDRTRSLNLNYKLISVKGTSEDAAVILAASYGALRIFTIGSHTGIDEFLEKKRQGMSSTLLLRMLYGSKLTELKGMESILKYNKQNYMKASFLLLCLVILLPILFYNSLLFDSIISSIKTFLSIK
ncbi:thiamin pyrophosphokinase, catalytic domain [Oxobacter pfennigii]|uniref:Thiamin pyrophosphokinase, catalytic domain n=1 Tax=Oxobacter pfennigii TaxID=36849 RepID=A0A0P8YYL0_9CLOT|nr:putative cytokinetic ring protein SteA [Oxobacter pfennigii]KPU44883.1 thiamin pyrophosphokinase, catalytic domain [Oxobacter pfennigii]